MISTLNNLVVVVIIIIYLSNINAFRFKMNHFFNNKVYQSINSLRASTRLYANFRFDVIIIILFIITIIFIITNNC